MEQNAGDVVGDLAGFQVEIGVGAELGEAAVEGEHGEGGHVGI